ncbi:cysteine-rich venom protein Mr30-like [Liolophura sinensis]|uniref:cysteine-rich venom protein Mr30-like n=1 Tax=Liolophura sinensis TaxID=3198878 RepID=UPI00315864FB
MGRVFALFLCLCVTAGENGVPDVGFDLVSDISAASLKDDRRKRQAVPECKDGYEKVENSTMCLVDSDDVISVGVTDEDKRIILREHNRYRAMVKPPAKNMMKIYWDDELARVATKWAKQCKRGHDLVGYMPKYNSHAGQNSAYWFQSWREVIQAWYDEVSFYRYGENPDDYLGEGGWTKTGHYAQTIPYRADFAEKSLLTIFFTQLVTDTNTLIGCGFSLCNGGYERYYFCNYLTGLRNLTQPYRSGEKCLDCPNSCNGNGLCDCPNTFCFNQGSLDIDTCSCTCKPPWIGPRCLQLPCDGKVCLNGGFLDTKACQCSCNYPYTGDVCETVSCEMRLDPSYCGRQWKQEQCAHSAVRGRCPVMCGLCEGGL